MYFFGNISEKYINFLIDWTSRGFFHAILGSVTDETWGPATRSNRIAAFSFEDPLHIRSANIFKLTKSMYNSGYSVSIIYAYLIMNKLSSCRSLLKLLSLLMIELFHSSIWAKWFKNWSRGTCSTWNVRLFEDMLRHIGFIFWRSLMKWSMWIV